MFVLPALFHKKELLGKDVLLCPRKDLAIFKIFCDSFLSCTHSKIDFKDRARTAVVSVVTTLSSEAYTLIYLENSYDTRYAEASEDEAIPARMYTQNQQTSSKYGGWKENGIVCYSKWQARVQKERKSIASKRLEKDYQAYVMLLHITEMVD